MSLVRTYYYIEKQGNENIFATYSKDELPDKGPQELLNWTWLMAKTRLASAWVPLPKLIEPQELSFSHPMVG